MIPHGIEFYSHPRVKVNGTWWNLVALLEWQQKRLERIEQKLKALGVYITDDAAAQDDPPTDDGDPTGWGAVYEERGRNA